MAAITAASQRVSIVIPTYNRADLLRQTLESVLAQTHQALEVIVVDDGSTDATPALLRQYGQRITTITQANQGGTAARNAGLRAATGAYISFLDHDDLLLPQKIERQLRMFTRRPELGVVHCRWHVIDRDQRKLATIGMLPEGDLFHQLVCGCFIWSGGPLIRRDLLAQVGPFDEAIWSSDWDMWLRIAQAGYRFGCVQEPLGCYRILPDSTMAEVARTERCDQRIFEKVFAAARLPAAVLASEGEAWANWRFWLSRRYYATQAWEDGRRNLAEALRLAPQLISDRRGFLQTLANEALDVRVSDPFGFVAGLFAHLPPEAQALNADRNLLASLVHAGLGLRHYAQGQIAAAQAELRAAAALRPGILDWPEEFARMAFAYGMRLPVDPGHYGRIVFDHLPAEARALAQLRARVTSDLQIGCAFEDYFAGRPAAAAGRIMAALVRRPAGLKNRGVLAILLRSLPAALRLSRPV